MTSNSVCYTREELYEQAWSQPMTKLANNLGLPDVGLRKKFKVTLISRKKLT